MIDPEVVAGLVERSDAAGLFRLCQHIAALVALAGLATLLPKSVGWIPALGYGIVLIFSFCPLHEAIHGSAFKTRIINRLVADLFGLVLLLPPRYFNVFHMTHHRYTQLAEKDPELLSAKPATVGQYLWHVSGGRYWKAQTVSLIGYSLGRVDDFVPAARRPQLITEARLFLLVYALITLWSVVNQNLVFWWYWLLPVAVGQPFLRFFLLAEHTGCAQVADMFDNTRTTQTNPVMQWLCWNMNFHTAHHAYAGVPFFRLPETNKLIEARLQHVGHGYCKVNRKIAREICNQSAQKASPN